MEKQLEQSINEINNLNQKIKEEAEKTNENGEKMSDDPGYALYNAISESTIDILSSDTVSKTFVELGKTIGPENAKTISELMAICMTHSAHNAIMFYDELLQKELTKQFDRIVDFMNDSNAVVKAHDGAIKVLRKSIDEIISKNLKDKV